MALTERKQPHQGIDAYTKIFPINFTKSVNCNREARVPRNKMAATERLCRTSTIQALCCLRSTENTAVIWWSVGILTNPAYHRRPYPQRVCFEEVLGNTQLSDLRNYIQKDEEVSLQHTIRLRVLKHLPLGNTLGIWRLLRPRRERIWWT